MIISPFFKIKNPTLSLLISFLAFLLSSSGLLKFNPKYIFALVSIIYFFEKLIKKQPILYPKKCFYYFLFLLSVFISFIKSKDLINSIDSLLIYCLLIYFFIIGYNESHYIKKNLKLFFIFSSLFFIFLSILCLFIKFDFYKTYLQLIYPFYQNHNHLGDFLGLALIYLMIVNIDYNKRIIFYFLFIFFLISFSKSAYLSFVLTTLFWIINSKILKKYQFFKKIFFAQLILVFLSTFIISSKKSTDFVNKNFNLKIFAKKIEYRPLLSSRLTYFYQAIKGFLDEPLFGWGPNNFIYISRKYSDTEENMVLTSLNLPLTILGELGIISFISFFIFILSFFIKAKNKIENPFFYLIFYMGINFFTDYTYLILPFFLLFFLFLGVFSQEEKNSSLTNTVPLELINIIIVFLIAAEFLIKILILSKNYDIKFFVFPFSHEYYQKTINYYFEKKDYKKAKSSLVFYSNISQLSYEKNEFVLKFILNKVKDYNFGYQLVSPFIKKQNPIYTPFSLVENFYYLKKQIFGKDEAKKFILDYYKNILNTQKFSFLIFRKKITDLCQKEKINECGYLYFNTPLGNKIEKNNMPLKAVYHLNNEGFNERFNYPINKEKDVFRILVVGDANAFGFLVNTKDNWVEKLEDQFKVQSSKLKVKYKKFEVINLAYHSYDLAYQVERFRQQGLKYKPDLVIWMNNDFSRINEIFLPLTEKYAWIENNPLEKEKYQKQGKNFPSWELAYEEYQKKIKEETIDVESYQKEKIKEFFNLYKGPLVFINLYDILDWVKETLLSFPNVYIFNPKEFSQNNNYYYEKVKAINPKGHEALAEMIYEFLVEKVLSSEH